MTDRIIYFIVLWLYCVPLIAQETTTPTSPDSAMSPKQAYLHLRGLEQDFRVGSNPWKWTKRQVMSVAQYTMSGLELASGFGMNLLGDDQFIGTVENFFFTDNRALGWYPVANLVSGFRPRIGANVLAHIDGFDGLLRGRYADFDKYQMEAWLAYTFVKSRYAWRWSFRALDSRDDDREFYGYGRAAQTDRRNMFLTAAEDPSGLFVQEYTTWEASIGFRPVAIAQGNITGGSKKRTIYAFANGDDQLGNVFDLAALPGYVTTVSHRFMSGSFRLDTRPADRYHASGWLLQGYVRYAHGIETDRSRFIQSGIDMAACFPVLLTNRMLMPRLVVESVSPISKQHPIPFTEYPQHPAFRGVSQRVMLRTDTHVVVPSLEYMWPIAANFSSHLFFDGLLATHHLAAITLAGATWAVGLGMDFHVVNNELARVELAIGPYGAHGSIDVGWTFH
ncbi:hypothetical protein JW960_25165 [candidate division KSB1 bacterium]|nr:hypothetical protein [candidate division KSB1 bacterium]